ncbi:cuticle protein 16.8-like [Limulus polyphemus]|uniref:Cuticle protein 16.8-like n=1 Tax=Limulus polyphemus TaxID=6850 RepID=A0ABM1S965_LIMPO|nr:cuticle protein 16.8-like [Limulus polyphemus]
MYKVALLCLVAAARATVLPASYGYAAPAYPAAYHPVKAAYAHPAPAYADVYAKPEPYSFGYEAKNDYDGALWQQESGDEYGSKRGSYGYTDAYGISRTVEYVADETGFHAWIKTNEPGTANQNPADVQIAADPAPAPAYTHPVAKAVVAAPHYAKTVVAAPHYAKAVVAAPAHYSLPYAH